MIFDDEELNQHDSSVRQQFSFHAATTSNPFKPIGIFGCPHMRLGISNSNPKMSKAKDQFVESINDAKELLDHFDNVTGGKIARPPNEAEVLKRAGLILALTAWETYVEDRVREYLEANLAGIRGSPIANLVMDRYEQEMKRFHTPNAEKTAELFRAYCGRDVTTVWRVWGGDSSAAKARLTELVRLRGRAAHRSPATGKKGGAPHLVSRPVLESTITFLEELVEATDADMESA